MHIAQLDALRKLRVIQVGEPRKVDPDTVDCLGIARTAVFEQSLRFFAKEFETGWNGHSTTSFECPCPHVGQKVRSLQK